MSPGFNAMSSGTIEGPQLHANKAQKALSIGEWSAINNTPSQQAMMPLYPVASRPPITSPRDQLDLITGLSPMRPSIRLERATMESERSTRFRYRGPSDAGVDPSSVTSRRPYHRGLFDTITDLDRPFILASQPSDQALSWLGGECAAPQQALQYLSAPFCWCGRHPIGLSHRTKAYLDLLPATHGCIPCCPNL